MCKVEFSIKNNYVIEGVTKIFTVASFDFKVITLNCFLFKLVIASSYYFFTMSINMIMKSILIKQFGLAWFSNIIHISLIGYFADKEYHSVTTTGYHMIVIQLLSVFTFV